MGVQAYPNRDLTGDVEEVIFNSDYKGKSDALTISIQTLLPVNASNYMLAAELVQLAQFLLKVAAQPQQIEL